MKDKIRQFLIERGYREWKGASHRHAELLFQRTYGEGEDRRKFINIWQYDMSDIRPERPLSFEVEICFETDTDDIWFEGQYYGISPDQLFKYVEQLEGTLLHLYDVLGGKLQ